MSLSKTVIHSTNPWLPQTQTWLYNQVRYLPATIENHIVCDKSENLDQFALPNLHCLWDTSRVRYYWDKAIRKLKLSRHSPFLVAQAKKHHAHLLHSHFGYAGWMNLGAARQAALKHIVTFYGFDVNYLPTQDPRWYERYNMLFEQVDRVLCEGSHMAKCIVQLGCPPEKVQVHHLGIAIEQLEFKPRGWQSGEPLRVLIAASFGEKKGIPYALEALGRLQEEVPLHITVIGDARDVPASQLEKQKILAVIEKYQLQPKISLLGYQPYATMFQAAYNHHIFLSPSVTAQDGDTEGGAPVSLIEMAATGMPIVSTTHCDIPEVVKHGVTGLLAAERDVEGLVEHLRWWIHHPDQWDRLLVAGRQHVEREYDARLQGQKLAEIYHATIDNPKGN